MTSLLRGRCADLRSSSSFPVLLVLAAVLSVQFGGALGATLIPVVGVVGAVAIRLGLGALIMLVLVRPGPRGHQWQDWATVGAFGLALAAMNTAFYASLSRLPIGVAVTVEFVGPLLLAAALSRHLRDGLAVMTAAAGVVLVSGVLTTPWSRIDLVGLLLAATAGAAWAVYIVLSARTGRRFRGTEGLAWAMVIGAMCTVPAGLWLEGTSLFGGEALVKGLGIAVLSSVLPYSLELVALRRMSAHVFGVLLSVEPAAAALAGFLVLGQGLENTQLLGMLLVTAASVGVTRRASDPVD
nr:EamA family transporter [Austwickia chelonae]